MVELFNTATAGAATRGIATRAAAATSAEKSMSSVQNAVSAQATANAPNTSSKTAPAASGFSGGDFQTFLKMLTTQIKNQDPLNPMEGSDFAVQLATFSGVEQQVKTNQLLEQLAGAQANGLSSMTGWIGKDIRTVAPIGFDGTPVTLDIQPETAANNVTLVTLDARGKEVMREQIDSSAGELEWTGLRSDGTSLPAGIYSFKLISAKGKEILKTSAVGAYARVQGVESAADGIRLTLPGGANAYENQVTALRDPR